MRSALLASATLALLVGFTGPTTALPLPESKSDEDARGGKPFEGPIPYVIVTTRALRSEFDHLAKQHTQCGLRAAVWTLESIRDAYPLGRDDAERIRIFLKDAYATRGARWALLGGDASVIPVREATLTLPPPFGATRLPTDQYYACLDGSWNADGDDDWGELASDAVDFVPELNVGRAPVGSKDEAKQFVSQTIDALDRHESTDGDVLLAAEALLNGLIDGAQFTEPLIQLFPTDPATHVTRLYENWAAWPGSSPESRVALIDALNEGHDLAVLVGAGAPGVLVAGDDHSASDQFTSEDAEALTNDEPTIVYVSSAYTCASAPDPSIGASLMNAKKGGAVAVLGATDIQFIATSRAFMSRFFQAAYTQGLPTLGEALTQAVVASGAASDVIRLTTQGTMLLGDPALPMRPAPVVTASAEGIPAVVAPWVEATGDDAGLGPSMAFIPAVSWARGHEDAAVAAVPQKLAMGAASPQPSSSHARLELAIPTSMDGLPLEVAAYDAAGRRVRTIERGTAKAGRRIVTWDLRSDAGTPAAVGIYFVTGRVGEKVITGRVAVVR